jgi:hypothetical protein
MVENLTTMRNEVTHAEAINLRAVNHWHQHSIPEPPKYPRSAEIDPTLPRERCLLQNLQALLFTA